MDDEIKLDDVEDEGELEAAQSAIATDQRDPADLLDEVDTSEPAETVDELQAQFAAMKAREANQKAEIERLKAGRGDLLLATTGDINALRSRALEAFDPGKKPEPDWWKVNMPECYIDLGNGYIISLRGYKPKPKPKNK